MGTPTVDPTITTRPATGKSAPPPPPPLAYLMDPNPFTPAPAPAPAAAPAPTSNPWSGYWDSDGNWIS